MKFLFCKCVNDGIKDTVTFTGLMKIYSTKYFCFYILTGLHEFFVQLKIFSFTVCGRVTIPYGYQLLHVLVVIWCPLSVQSQDSCVVEELTRLMGLSLGEPIPAYSRREQTSYRYMYIHVGASKRIATKYLFFLNTLQSHLSACGRLFNPRGQTPWGQGEEVRPTLSLIEAVCSAGDRGKEGQWESWGTLHTQGKQFINNKSYLTAFPYPSLSLSLSLSLLPFLYSIFSGYLQLL